jgi:hypothetical protein
LRAATRSDLAFPCQFTVALANVRGGGGLDELTKDLYIPILIRFRLNKLGLGFSMPALWRGFVFLGSVSNGQRRGRAEDGSDIYSSFPDFAGGHHTSEEHELAGSGVCASSGSGQVRLLPLPHLLQRTPLAKILRGMSTDSP